MLLLVLSLSLVAFGQQGNVNDILFTKSGEIIQGKVVKVTGSTISFSYPGESLINEIGSDQLQKIVFSSGRTQNFSNNASGNTPSANANNTTPPDEAVTTTTIPKEEIYLGPGEDTAVENNNNNRLAVTPMTFLVNGRYSKEISGQATQFATDYLARQNQSLPIEVQDMGMTIRKLVDAGIGFQQLSQTTSEKLQNVLGTEYLVLIEVNETHQKAQPKKDTGFFDTQKEQTDSNSNVRYEIEVILFGAGGAEAYSSKFSNERSFKSALGNNSPKNDWKTAMQYVLDQILTSGSL
ncbi:hypothetical protein CLV81_3179 [Flagellimonas meridianipacifica]|uniref:Uncharacterized protein n=2 Tax=Flagellimonas meridianipacifica TaxID=1080225 RepID=A0A2T0MBC5_9FLAO|nr:hypothetical protein CLV81_3179 [Allomuricauda pacifica]